MMSENEWKVKKDKIAVETDEFARVSASWASSNGNFSSGFGESRRDEFTAGQDS